MTLDFIRNQLKIFSPETSSSPALPMDSLATSSPPATTVCHSWPLTQQQQCLPLACNTLSSGELLPQWNKLSAKAAYQSFFFRAVTCFRVFGWHSFASFKMSISVPTLFNATRIAKFPFVCLDKSTSIGIQPCF